MCGSKPPPLKLLNLMCQCTVQTQLGHYAEFKNEMRSRWLEAFLGHEHLRVVYTGSKTTRLEYRGLSDGLRCSWRDYLATMLRGKPERYEVRYAVGTADPVMVPRAPAPQLDATAPTPPPAPPLPAPPSPPPVAQGGSSAEAAKAAWLARLGGAERSATAGPPAAPTPSAAPPWAAASASRKSNPFLAKEQPTYREYTEVLEPRRIATGLIAIARQLAAEWKDDLARLSREGAYLAEMCEEQSDGCDIDRAPMTMMATLGSTTAAAHDVTKTLPPVIYASFRAATAAWNSDLNEDGVSPFRAENYDLLQRAVTREAALSALADLEQARARRRAARGGTRCRGGCPIRCVAAPRLASARWSIPALLRVADMTRDPLRSQLAPTSSAHAASALWLRERIEARPATHDLPIRRYLGNLIENDGPPHVRPRRRAEGHEKTTPG